MSIFNMPEPRVEPPEDYSVKADCGHDVFEDEDTFLWEGEWLCPDCFKDKIKALALTEVADIFGCDHKIVRRAR